MVSILSGESWGGRAMDVAGWSGSLLGWERELTGLKDRLAPVFGRSELRQSAGAFIDGVLSGIARKSGWQLAEQAGLGRPYRMQSLLGRSCWGADALRDLVRDEVIARLGEAWLRYRLVAMAKASPSPRRQGAL